mgnify:CR=1 FL=1
MTIITARKIEKKNKARLLLLKGLSLKEISNKLNISYNTVAYWAREEKWKKREPITTAANRCTFLIDKKHKTDYEWKEIHRLQEFIHKFSR